MTACPPKRLPLLGGIAAAGLAMPTGGPGVPVATPIDPSLLVGESQTEPGVLVARDEDSAMPPPDCERFTPRPIDGRVRDRRETEMHVDSPRDRGSRKERRAKIARRGCERMDDSAASSSSLGDSWCPLTAADTDGIVIDIIASLI